MITDLVTFAYPLYEMRVQLDGDDFVLLFDYSQREDAWYLTVSDIEASPIVRGVKLMPGIPLLKGVADRRRPKGELFIFAPSMPGFTDWAHTKLAYLDEAEVNSALGIDGG